MRAKFIFVAIFFFLSFAAFDSVEAKKKKAPKGPNMGGGSPFAQSKAQMVFITIRDGYTPPQGIQKMAKDFQTMMSTGGLQVGLVGTDETQMVAVANTIRELIEVRKFATNMEEVLKVEYDKSKFAGKYITEAERKEHDLPAEEEKEDL